jgi:hypothetical protein
MKMPEQIFGYHVNYQGENMAGCIKSENEEAARNQLRNSFRLPAHIEISIYPQKFGSSGIWEIYYGC